VDRYKLEQHVEGGWYARHYASTDSLHLNNGLPDRFSSAEKESAPRLLQTAIYYMLQRGEVSRLHALKSDEMFHFYMGHSMVVVEIDRDGKLTETTLGHDILHGETVQHTVKAGNIFGAYLKTGSEFALVGANVVPGFDFRDFHVVSRASLVARFPTLPRDLVDRLTEP